MTERNDRPVRDFAQPGSFVTLITRDADKEQRGRPVTVQEEFDGRLRFLISRSTEWAENLPVRDDAHPNRSAPGLVVIAETNDNVFATLSGALWLTDHRGTIERLWSPAAKAFFAGPDDPDAIALEFETEHGQWWGGPSTKIGNVVALVRAAVTRDESEAGDAGEVVPR